MSKFIDSIEARLTGRRYAGYSPLLKITESTVPCAPEAPTLNEYRVKVTYGANISCEEPQKAHMIKNVIHDLRDDMYGDLRRKMRALERHIYAHEMEDARGLIADIFVEIGG